MARLHLSLLGGFAARRGPRSPVPLASRKAQALLAYLALRPGETHPRARLAALLWGDAGEAQARSSLRQTLVTLRRALPGDGLLVAAGDALGLRPGAVAADVPAFERLVASGAPGALARAVAAYRGDLLDGLAVDAPAFEDWLRTERERLRELAVGALGRLLAHEERAGRTERAIRTAGRLLAVDPLRESAHRTLMRLHLRQGHRALALRQYQQCVEVLQRELGIEPEAETQALYRDLLRRAGPGPAAASGPGSANVPREAGRAAPGALPGPEEAPRPGPPRPPGGRPPADAPPFVGRREELARLAAALDAAGAGHGRALLLVGDAGIGKTRLVEALAAEGERRRARVLWGRCHAAERVLPFRPWVDALRAGGALAALGAREAFPAAWRAELARLFPELGPARPARPAGPEDAGRLFEAASELLGRLARRPPLVLVLEDLQWADDMSLRLFAFVAHRLERHGLLLAGTAREDEAAGAPAWRGLLAGLERAPHARVLPVPPLSRPETLALLRALGPSGEEAAGRPGLREEVWALSGGNPFVVVEATRAFAEGPAPAAGGLVLPRRVRTLIEERLDRLREPARRLLAVAAAVGREASFALLQQAAGLEEAAAAEAIDDLVRRRLLHAVGEGFDLTHERIRAVVAERLVRPDVRRLHGAVAAALEALPGDRGEAGADRLAEHYAAAADVEKAVTHLVRFAEQAARGYALEAAARSLEQAGRFAARLPPPARDRRVLEVALRRAEALHPLGRFQEIVDLLLAERPRLDALADPAVTGPYEFRLGYTLGLLGDHEQAGLSLWRALREATRCGDGLTTGQAHLGLAREGFWTGRLRESVEHGRQAVALLAPAAEAWWLGEAAWVLGTAHAFRGEFAAARRQEARARAVGRRIGDARLQHRSEWGLIQAMAGEADAAIAACERSLAACHHPLDAAIASAHLGYAHLQRGEAAPAVRLLERARAELERFGMRSSLGRVLAWLGQAYLAAGRRADARAAAERGLDLTRGVGYRYGEGEAERTVGLVAAAEGDARAAAGHLERALAVFEAIEAPFEAARTRLALAEAASAAAAGPGPAGAGAARDHLARARARFRELGVPRYVERADALAAARGLVLDRPARGAGRPAADPAARPGGRAPAPARRAGRVSPGRASGTA
jgi:DNA-binding SARP family transcriptional activator